MSTDGNIGKYIRKIYLHYTEYNSRPSVSKGLWYIIPRWYTLHCPRDAVPWVKYINCYNDRYVIATQHDDVIKWNHFPCYWPFIRGILRHRYHCDVIVMHRYNILWGYHGASNKYNRAVTWKYEHPMKLWISLLSFRNYLSKPRKCLNRHTNQSHSNIIYKRAVTTTNQPGLDKKISKLYPNYLKCIHSWAQLP